MKTPLLPARLAVLATVPVMLALTSAGSAQAAEQSAQAIPIIQFDSVQLSDVIKNLGRQAGMNFLLDPHLSEPSIGPDGKLLPTPKVTARYENSTAKDALLAVLKQHELELVESPVTKVLRIARAGQATNQVDAKWVAADTNTIPLIVMDFAPLDIALQNLARQSQLRLTVDPAVSRPPLAPGGRPVMPPTVSFRFENLTARQALAALVENYDLVLSVDAASGAVSIAPRRKADAAPSEPSRGKGPGQ